MPFCTTLFSSILKPALATHTYIEIITNLIQKHINIVHKHGIFTTFKKKKKSENLGVQLPTFLGD